MKLEINLEELLFEKRDELVEEIIYTGEEYEFVKKLAEKRKKLDENDAIFDEIIFFFSFAYPDSRNDEINDNDFSHTEESVIDAEEAIKKLQAYVENCKNYLSINKLKGRNNE